MVNKKGIIDNIHYFIDDYLEDGKIMKGRKGSELKTPNNPGYSFIIGNSKTINQIFKQLRKEKFKRLLI